MAGYVQVSDPTEADGCPAILSKKQSLSQNGKCMPQEVFILGLPFV